MFKVFGRIGYFKIGGKTCIFSTRNSKFINFLLRLGIKPGKNDKSVPNIIKKHRKLWNAEGSIYLRYRKLYNNLKKLRAYYVVQLKMKDKDPVTSFKLVMEKYGINPF